MRKRLTAVFLILCSLAAFQLTQVAFAYQTEISVMINGKKLDFDQPPIIVDGRTLVPLRGIFEELGATVDWNPQKQKVTAVKDKTEIEITIGDNILYKNGHHIALDVPAQIVNDRTLVPVRAVSEAFGCDVGWNEKIRTVTVSANSKTDIEKKPVSENEEEFETAMPNTVLGYVTCDSEYTYFVNDIANSDGLTTDQIVKIGNDKSAKPEVIFSAEDVEGYTLGMSCSPACLFASKERVYFFYHIDGWDSGDKLCWVTKDGKTSGVVQDFQYIQTGMAECNKFHFDGRYLYYYEYLKDSGKFFRFDPDTEEETELEAYSLGFNDNNFRYYGKYVIGVYNGMVYYVKGGYDGNFDNGIYYSDIKNSSEHELCAIANAGGLARSVAVYFSGEYMYIEDEEMAINLKTGAKSNINVPYNMYYVYTFLDSKCYYCGENGDILSVSPGNKEPEIVIEDPAREDKEFLQIANGWLYYKQFYKKIGDYMYYRVRLDGKILPSTPICEIE